MGIKFIFGLIIVTATLFTTHVQINKIMERTKENNKKDNEIRKHFF